MDQSKLKNSLETITNLAVLLAASGVLIALSWGYFAQSQTPLAVAGMQRGQSLAQLPTVDYAGKTQTLLIAMNTQCQYCTESVSFYNTLADRVRPGSKGTRIVAVFPNKKDEVQKYVDSNGFRLETLADVDFATLNVSFTPTVMLVDSHGKLIDFWIGKVSTDIEQQILSTVSIQ